MDKAPETTNGPIEVPVESGKTYWWCSCGRSRNQPFCDGSHKGTEFSPLAYATTETTTKRFCVCKRTGTPPLCDDSDHSTSCARGAA
jgi:CDGSH-type Zn-finger protein